MTPINNRNADDILLAKLKEILLKEERERIEAIANRLEEPAYLEEKISPIFEEQINELKRNFPKEYEATINQLIEQKIKDSQEDIVNIIYPMLGKMIKKYVTLQIQSFKDAADERIKNTFTVSTVIQKMKASFFGVKESDVILSTLIDYQIEEVYLIQKNSGLLLGTASRGTTIDRDVIAGMLTAIKAFVEDAFKREQEDLELIQYQTYKIILQSFPSSYLAVAINGSISNAQQNQLQDKILDFASENLKDVDEQVQSDNVQIISDRLYNIFIESNVKQ